VAHMGTLPGTRKTQGEPAELPRRHRYREPPSILLTGR
jgi:hypothetical protein